MPLHLRDNNKNDFYTALSMLCYDIAYLGSLRAIPLNLKDLVDAVTNLVKCCSTTINIT